MTPSRYRRIRRVLDRRQPDLTVLLDHVNKPHNLSAVLRSCDGVGILEAHAVTGEHHIRASRATSAGSGRWVPLRNHQNPAAALEYLRGNGMQVLVAHPSSSSVDFRSVDYTVPTAVVLGAELYGPGSQSVAGADRHIHIPLLGMVPSLNVSVAAALILYEAQRQRDLAGFYERPRLDPESYWRWVFRWGYPRLARYFERKGLGFPRMREEDGSLLDPVPEEAYGGEAEDTGQGHPGRG